MIPSFDQLHGDNEIGLVYGAFNMVVRLLTKGVKYCYSPIMKLRSSHSLCPVGHSYLTMMVYPS